LAEANGKGSGVFMLFDICIRQLNYSNHPVEQQNNLSAANEALKGRNNNSQGWNEMEPLVVNDSE